MSEVLPSIVYQLGLGGIGGLIVGYALKKLSKLILVLVGLFIAFLIYLGVEGVISVNYSALLEAISNFLGLASGAFSWFVNAISLIPFAASFTAGFLIGFKLG
ncbi:hypothetical protein KEJ45_05835 [Candidatus Bathyarchaeota archaeon]|nr:hypothetical protein [Candidatus Bathyarchaeota archaeon]